MSKEPLYPHVPKSRQPLFPHVPGGRPVVLPQTEKASAELKYFWVEKNLPYDTWAIVEAWPGGTVRSPFLTKEEAIKREEEFGAEYEWKLKRVSSPQEKFPKQHEALKKLYPYIIVEYHDNGDLTIRELISPAGKGRGFEMGKLYVVTTEGQTFEQEKIIGYFAKTEGDSLRKFCCRQCGECAPTELLEEGRFPDRIAWLRHHYMEKHPGMWGKMSPMTVEDGEPIPSEYRHLVGLISEPLPKEAY